MRKFCNLGAILLSMILNVNFFLEGMILNEKNLWKEQFWNRNFSSCQILNRNFFTLSDLESIFLQRVKFQNEYFTTCQVLDVLLLQKFAKFSRVQQNRARFGNVWMYAMGSVNQVILSG